MTVGLGLGAASAGSLESEVNAEQPTSGRATRATRNGEKSRQGGAHRANTVPSRVGVPDRTGGSECDHGGRDGQRVGTGRGKRPGRRSPGVVRRRARAHPARVQAGDRRGRRRPRVRRPSHQGRPPGLRPRPAHRPHLERPRHPVHPRAGRAERAGLGVLAGHLGGLRGSRDAGPGQVPDPHPAPAARGGGRRRPAGRGGDRDQAPHPVRRPGRAPPGRAARRVRLGRGRLAGAGDELLPAVAAPAAVRWRRTCAR